MPKSYSMDLHERVLNRLKWGITTRAAELYEIVQCLAPTLKRGDIVIMHNLPMPKVTGVRQAIEAARAQLLYLPPYSPDLNPIEMAFFKLKALLRKAAERRIPGLLRNIGRIAKASSPRVQT